MNDRSGCTQAAGLWQVKEDVQVDDDAGRLALDTYIFAFDGETVVLRLTNRHAGQWKSDDDFYRLAAECRGEALYIRPPFADWIEIATFEDGRFIQMGSGRKRIFERIETPRWPRGTARSSPRANRTTTEPAPTARSPLARARPRRSGEPAPSTRDRSCPVPRDNHFPEAPVRAIAFICSPAPQRASAWPRIRTPF